MTELPRFQSGKPLDEQITAERMNALVDAINENTLNQGDGVRITRNNGNTTISAVKTRERLDIRPFTPFIAQDSSGLYQARVSKGLLLEIKLDSYESIVYHEPDGIVDPITGDPVWHDLTLGQGLFLETQYDIKGRVVGVPVVVVQEDSGSTVSSHYFPEVGDYAGAEGTVLYKLFVLESDTAIPKKFFSGQNILHYAERVTMINLESGSGEIRKVLKDYEPDIDKVNFRTLSQLPGDGETIIKDAVEGEDDSIEFKRIKQRDSDPQVTVTDDGDAIKIEGNGVDGDNAAVTVVDGLVTEVKDTTANLNMLVQQVYIDAGVVEFVREHYLCWRLGLYVGKFDEIGDCPAHVGTLDASTVTYIGTEPPP